MGSFHFSILLICCCFALQILRLLRSSVLCSLHVLQLGHSSWAFSIVFDRMMSLDTKHNIYRHRSIHSVSSKVVITAWARLVSNTIRLTLNMTYVFKVSIPCIIRQTFLNHNRRAFLCVEWTHVVDMV